MPISDNYRVFPYSENTKPEIICSLQKSLCNNCNREYIESLINSDKGQLKLKMTKIPWWKGGGVNKILIWDNADKLPGSSVEMLNIAKIESYILEGNLVYTIKFSDKSADNYVTSLVPNDTKIKSVEFGTDKLNLPREAFFYFIPNVETKITFGMMGGELRQLRNADQQPVSVTDIQIVPGITPGI